MNSYGCLTARRNRMETAVRAGLSAGDAISLKSESIIAGMVEEYLYIEACHGQEGRDWEKISQTLVRENGRRYDLLNIRLKNGMEKTYYFDLTPFYKPYYCF